jgi:hypothetical protein
MFGLDCYDKGREKKWAFVKTVMNAWILKNSNNFSITWETITSARMDLVS